MASSRTNKGSDASTLVLKHLKESTGITLNRGWSRDRTWSLPSWFFQSFILKQPHKNLLDYSPHTCQKTSAQESESVLKHFTYTLETEPVLRGRDIQCMRKKWPRPQGSSTEIHSKHLVMMRVAYCDTFIDLEPLPWSTRDKASDPFMLLAFLTLLPGLKSTMKRRCMCLAFPGYLLSVPCHKMAPCTLHNNRILLCSSPYPSSSSRCIFRKIQSKGFILTTLKMDLWPRLPFTALYRNKKKVKHQQGPPLKCRFSFDALETLGRGNLSRSSSSVA